MADLTKRIICIVLYWMSQMQLISAQEVYCEWGLCGENEVCCKLNQCCPVETWNVFIFLWIVAGVIIAILSYLIYKHKYQFCRIFSKHPEEKPIMA